MLVYKITNKINGKSYVGQTVQSLERRWKKHITQKSHCHALKSAILKYGPENFEIKTLTTYDSIEKMNDGERYYINLFNTLAPDGYNLTNGGIRPSFSKEARANMGRKKEKHHLWGKKHSEETKHKISVAHMGKKRGKDSEETRKKKSLAQIGSTHSLATRKILSKNSIFLYRNNKAVRESFQKANDERKISIICNETKVIYDSILSAANALGGRKHASNMVQHLKGEKSKYKVRSIKGFTFSYYEDQNV